jgi:digeranylgeranylglycerophospholipid reductase
MDYNYDIIIVGAGPAGLNAGIFAAKQGAEVLVLDKKKELGIPVRCGEAVIENIFHDFNIKPTKDIVANRVNSMKLFSSKGKKIKLDIKLYGYILKRDKFEQHLGARARAKGVKIQLNTTVIGYKKNQVKITSNDGKTSRNLKARIVIGADGVESRLGRWAGIDTQLKPEDIAVCQQYLLEDIEVDKKAVEFYWGSKYSPHAYIWVFPKSDNSANVGIVTLGSVKADLGKFLNNFIQFRAPTSKKTHVIAGCVPQANPPSQVLKDNVLLVGDAARVAIPVTGAGIGHALVTGKWAGELAGKVITDRRSISELKNYEIMMDKIRKKIQRSYELKQKVLKNDDFYELLFALAKPVPYLYGLFPELFHKLLLKNLRY